MSSSSRHRRTPERMQISVMPPASPGTESYPTEREIPISVSTPEFFEAASIPKMRAEPAPGAPPGPIAILVCHGMGQQVPFETLDCVAKTIVDSTHAQHPTANVRLVHSEHDERMPRAELKFTLAGTTREVTVHLYEAYWAPVTEGQVRLIDAVRFLIGAGWHGIGFSLRGSFQRRMFGHEASMPLKSGTSLVLLFALLSIAAVIGLAFAAFLLAAGEIARAFLPGIPNLPLLSAIACELRLYAVAIFPIAAIILVTMIKPIRRGVEARPALCKVLQPILNGLALLALGVTVAAFVDLLRELPGIIASAGDLASPYGRGETANSGKATAHAILGVVVWLIGVAGLFKIRSFLIQYVGDVAVYVSSHTVSRFSEIRNKIQGICLEVAAFIYGAKRADGSGNLYDHVIVVGHSLGSVVAYDALNGIINRAMIEGTSKEGGEGNGERLDVVRRTPLFLTFGSPLDKTAFIFRSQLKDAIFREALAEAVQPLIQSYAYRPTRWINIFSPADWISGSLEFYDDPVATSQSEEKRELRAEPERVQNRPDRNAFLPLAAHTGYWNHPGVGEALFEAITEVVG